MVIKYTENTLANIYRDDYDPDKGFHKILFNSGRGLQARELTQLQTIIQEGVARFGRNIFKEGACVNPGSIVINKRYAFIKLDTSTYTLPATPSSLVGRSFVGQLSNVIVQVLQVVEAEGSDPATLYVKYTSTLNGVAGPTSVRVTPGEDLLEYEGSINLKVQTTNTTLNPAYGNGTKISIGASEFFALGYFVQSPAQELIISKYTRNPTAIIGFKATQDVVTANDDATLYDNQGANPNYTAPGADRFRIQFELIDKADIVSGETFVYFCEIVDGTILDQVNGFDQYNKINDLLAVRTAEESGNYTVEPFYISIDELDSDETSLQLRVSPGKAYVNGYRIVKRSSTTLTIPKPTDTSDEVVNEPIAVDFGYYVLVPLTDLVNIPDLNTYDEVTLNSLAGFTGDVSGTARIRSIETYAGFYRIYLFDIQMESGSVFEIDVKSIGTSTTNYANVYLEDGSTKVKIKDAQNENVFFPLPKARPSQVDNVSYVIQKKYSAVATGGGELQISTGSATETFTNTSEWIVRNATTGAIATFTNVTGVGTTSATITNSFTPSVAYNIMAYVSKNTTSPSSKTRTLATLTTAYSEATGYIDLGNPDLIEVVSIQYGGLTGNSALDLFDIDDGQRDTHYQNAKLYLKAGKVLSSNSLYITYYYYKHTAGDFFSVNSYTDTGVSYSDIPTYTLSNGSTVDLRNVLDFRSTMGDDGQFTSADAIVRPLPKNSEIINADITYYLPRLDKLVLNEDGSLQLLRGKSSFRPRVPKTPENCMELWRISLNPNTISTTDLSSRMIENKRYTMRDIGKIEKRVENLEEVTALSLLELDTKNINVLDEFGNNRFKSGFFVDNFTNQVGTAIRNPEYRASIDPQQRLAYPRFKSRSIDFFYDSDASTNTILVGDTVYLKYNEISYLSQPEATGTENVNPYMNVGFNGYIKLAPSSDVWKETEYLADNVISGGTVLDTDQALIANEHQSQWAGVDLNSLQVGDQISSFTQQTGSSDFSFTSGNTTTSGTTITEETGVNAIVGSSTILEVIGDRVVDVAYLPYQRSKMVYFKAQGLQPNSRMFAYYDGKDVSQWVKQEPFVSAHISKLTDWGNTQVNATQHPNGKTQLYSNARGYLEGSFFIPSTDAIKFRTGKTTFRLLDISVNEPDNAVTKAQTVFHSKGVLETRQLDVLSTRVLEVVGSTSTENKNINVNVDVREPPEREDSGRDKPDPPERDRPDPLAQSFFIKEGDGVYITKAAVYFATKDTTLPVWVQIRPMVNGYPSSNDIVPNSVKLLNPSEVITSTDASIPTYFVFEEPVFLNSFTEYALVVVTDSPDYNLYRSKLGEFRLGTTESRVSTQPTLGTFFKSQNANTWTAAQFEDMKFDLYRADWTDSLTGSATFKNVDLPRRILRRSDAIELWADSDSPYEVKVNHPYHGFVAGDTVSITDVDSADDFGTYLNGTKTITAVDHTGYTFTQSSLSAVVPSPFIRRLIGDGGIKVTQNYMYNTIFPNFETLEPNTTSISYNGKFYSGKSYAGNETPYLFDGTSSVIKLKENNNFDYPRIVPNAIKAAALDGTGEIKGILITAEMSTTNPQVAPAIDLERASAVLIENTIDNPTSSATSISNVPINFVDETDPSNGSAASKHITKQVTLINPARGLKIILGANRPSVANINVYYKVSNGKSLKNISWVSINPESLVPSDDNPNVFREYTYLVGGDTGLTEEFNTFQIKIVFTSSNSSKIPVLRDIRAIALGV